MSLKSWQDRSNTLGILPGKSSDQLVVLAEIASQLPAPDSANFTITSSKSRSLKTSVEDICAKQLSRTGLVERDGNNNWTPSQALKRWIEDGDPVRLADGIHNHVKFFGELVSAIGEDTSPVDLLDTAQGYGLAWTSKDQVNRRIAWLKSLQFVEQWTYAGPLVVTDLGREFLTSVTLCSPQDAVGNELVPDEPEDLPEAEPAIAQAIAELTDEKLASRKVIIGYIPKGKKVQTEESSSSTSASPLESIRRIVGLLDRRGTTVDDFFSRASEEFGLKKTSFDQTLHTVRHMGLIDLVAFNKYAPTERADDLLQLGREIDLIRFLHCRYSFIGELMAHLPGPTSASSLVAIANNDYGLKQIDNSEIRTRLGLLADANIVERVDWTRYKPTAYGLALVQELPKQDVSGGVTSTVQQADEGQVSQASEVDEKNSLVDELRRFSRTGEASTAFEASVRRAFEFLGFDAEHLGGAGRTDVLLTAVLGPGSSYTAIVDAKAASSGTVSESQVNFNALKDHKKKHKAGYGILVGPDFAKRVRDWAPDNEFSLISVEQLVRIIELHESSPMTLPQLKHLFTAEANSAARIISEYESLSEHRVLISRLLEILYEEAADTDPVAGGFVSRENLQYILRKEYKPRPQKTTIDECLAMLESQLVRGVEREAGGKGEERFDRFRLSDSPLNVRLRLARLGADISIPAIAGDDDD